jgi:hypothetical protein
MIWLAGYIATIFAANWALAAWGMVPIGFGLLAPASVWFAGLAFTFRDRTHDALGRRWTIAAIVAGAACSALVSPTFALASSAAFLLSETADFAVFDPLRRRSWLTAVAPSPTASASSSIRRSFSFLPSDRSISSSARSSARRG